MEVKISRPWLVAGSIISVLVFLFLILFAKIGFDVFKAFGAETDQRGMIFIIFLLIFTISGAIFSIANLCICKLNSKKFAKMLWISYVVLGLCTATIIELIILSIIAEQFNWVIVACMLLLALGLAFISIDIVKSKKLDKVFNSPIDTQKDNKDTQNESTQTINTNIENDTTKNNS